MSEYEAMRELLDWIMDGKGLTTREERLSRPHCPRCDRWGDAGVICDRCIDEIASKAKTPEEAQEIIATLLA